MIPEPKEVTRKANVYKCKGCDYQWTLNFDWQKPPKCPDCGADLKLIKEGTHTFTPTGFL
jgi:transposase-like protein